MVKEKSRCYLNRVIKTLHGLNPFCEVINHDNDVFVPIARGRSTFHEFDPPFLEGTGRDDGVE
jgi:hypothetical protein